MHEIIKLMIEYPTMQLRMQLIKYTNDQTNKVIENFVIQVHMSGYCNHVNISPDLIKHGTAVNSILIEEILKMMNDCIDHVKVHQAVNPK